MAETGNVVENLKAIIDEFDAQVEQDLKDIYESEASTDEPFARNGTEPPIEETEVVSEPQAMETAAASEPARKSPKEDIEDKNWLFEENIRLREVERHLEEEKERLENYEKELDKKAKDIEAMNEKFIRDRAQFRDEMNLLTGQVTRERQRLKQDEQFFDKKMEILKAGFADLDKAKRELEAQKMRYEAQSSYYGDDDIPGYGAPIARSLFVGITNPLMLKKRYKDLVKIYHPDNLAGDHDLFKAITLEYERLQGKIGSEGIG